MSINPGIFITISVVAAAIAAIASSLIATGISRRKMRKTYDRLLQQLDRAIAGEIQESTYDESMEAAVLERLNRVVRISSVRRNDAEGERDAVKALISDISHQIRTPLSNIILYTDLLKEQIIEQEAVTLVEKVQKNASKLDFFMKELVRTSYAEQELISVYPELVSAEEIVEKSCQNVEIAALKKNIKIERTLLDAGCYADKKWTIEAVGNVIENAVKYSAPHQHISVCIIAYEAFVCIRVTDFGIGIPEAEQGKIFQRFYRGEQVRQEPGFGIGLYLTREVLSKQGGYVRVQSQPGQGTTVNLYLSRYAV